VTARETVATDTPTARAAAANERFSATMANITSPSRSGSFDIDNHATIDFHPFYFKDAASAIVFREAATKCEDFPRLPTTERSRVETAEAALNTRRRKAMSYTVSTLLLRNLDDVFGQIDPLRRRAAIDEIFHEDAVFHDPNGGIYHGRDEIARIAGVIKATHPDFRYQPISPPEEMGDGGRVRWVSGSPGDPPAYAGTDFIIARDGKIAAVYLFFDELPSLRPEA